MFANVLPLNSHPKQCGYMYGLTVPDTFSPSNRPSGCLSKAQVEWRCSDGFIGTASRTGFFLNIWGCSVAQMCLSKKFPIDQQSDTSKRKLYMPFGYFEFEKVYGSIYWSNFRRVQEISSLCFCLKHLLEVLWTRPVGFILNLQQSVDIQRWCTHPYKKATQFITFKGVIVFIKNLSSRYSESGRSIILRHTLNMASSL